MKIFKSIIITALAIFMMASCTDVIDVNTDPADPILVVDAWLTDQPTPQTIRLTQSQPYFDNNLSTGVTGAIVTMETGDGDQFSFADQGNGNYVWTPTTAGELGGPGTFYTLTIEWNGNIYTSETRQNGAPPVDSITQEFRVDDLSGPDGIYTEFFARDLPGLGNTYWIKTFKNGEFLNKPSEMNLAYDAAFAAGSEVDNLIFIPPIREATNRIPDPDTEDDQDVPPWAPGDVIRVEIHSLSNVAFDFLTLAREQMTNGDNTIFAVPLANTTSNVVNAATGDRALGYFNVAKMTFLEKVIE